MEELFRKIKSHANQVCIIERNESFRYDQLLDTVDSYRAALAAKEIRKAMTVVLKGDYSFYSISLLLALAANDNIIVPVTDMTPAEVDLRVTESRADAIIHVNGNELEVTLLNAQSKYEIVNKLNDASRSGLILFSSGSTGKPKAMIHDFDTLVESYLDKRGKSLVFLVFLLFDHIGGINTLLNCLSMGAVIVIPETREPDYICKLIERHKINVLPSSPTFLNLMLMNLKEKSYDFSSLKLITYGTEAMPESLLHRIREKFGNVKLVQTFGTSETGIAKTSSQSSSSTLMKIEQGETQYKIVNGELFLKSTTQILGYLNHSSESFTPDGWFRTGDLAEETSDGYIRILGRLKEVINVGGEKVLPVEVESVVMQMTEVEDCAAYAAPNAITGQSVGIFVTSDFADHKLLKQKIRSYCRERLEPYKVPTKIDVVERLQFSQRFKKVRA